MRSPIGNVASRHTRHLVVKRLTFQTTLRLSAHNMNGDGFRAARPDRNTQNGSLLGGEVGDMVTYSCRFKEGDV